MLAVSGSAADVDNNEGWKYAVFEGQPWLLYNLNEDPFETANLAWDDRSREERSRCRDRLASWIFDTGDSFFLPDVTRRA